MGQQKAVVKSINRATSAKKGVRIRKKSFTFSVKCDLAGTYEVAFQGSMTEPFLSANRFTADGIDGDKIERAYIDLVEVTQIDDEGVDLVLRLMKTFERMGIKFQLLYSEGQVASKIESSGLMSYFAKPTWSYR